MEELIPCGPQDLSFFDFADSFDGGPKALRRCLSIVRSEGVQTIGKEALTDADPVTEADVAYFADRALELSRTRTRLNFSKDTVDQIEAGGDLAAGYLGQCLVYEDSFAYSGIRLWKKTYVSEAVLRLPETPAWTHRYVHCARDFVLTFHGQSMTVRGVLFAQQPQHSGSCAHASALMAAKTLGVVDPALSYLRMQADLGFETIPHFSEEHLAERGIISLLSGIVSEKGLSVPELRQVLSNLGLDTVSFPFPGPGAQPIDGEGTRTGESPGATPAHVVYQAIESGFPTLLCFQTSRQGHVIPVVGHGFNEDMWLPEAEQDYFDISAVAESDYAPGKVRHIRSSAWTSNFIACDDNYGPYYCLPNYAWQNGWVQVIVLVPKGFTFVPHIAEPEAAVELCGRCIPTLQQALGWPRGKWGKRLVEHAEDGKLILRTLTVSRGEYLDQMSRSIPPGESASTWEDARGTLADWLPERFWLTEVSIPELYATNGAKLADVYVEALDERTVRVLGIRVPEQLVLRGQDQYGVYPLPGLDGRVPIMSQCESVWGARAG